MFLKAKKLFFSIIIFVILAIFQSCEKSHIDTNVDFLVLKLGFSKNLNEVSSLACKQFKNEVEKETNGKIIIELIPNLPEIQLLEAFKSKKLDMILTSAANYSLCEVQCGYSSLPYQFDDLKTAREFIDSNLNKTINKKLEQYNMTVLAEFENGFKCVISSRPIKFLDDIKNLKICTAPNKISMQTFYDLNANSFPIDFTKLNDALKNDQFEANENSIATIFNSKLYENHKYITITNHSYDSLPLVINKALFQKLSIKNQEILKTAALNAQNTSRQTIEEKTPLYIEELEKIGITIEYIDLTEFKKASETTKKIYTKFAGKIKKS